MIRVRLSSSFRCDQIAVSVRRPAAGDWGSPELQASAKATATTIPVGERRAQPTMVPQRQIAVAVSLAKSGGATRKEERKKQGSQR